MIMRYQAAIEVFDDLASGRVPNAALVVAGTASLEFAALEYSSGDFERARQFLKSLISGHSLVDLDTSRCAYFSQILTKAQV